VLSRFYEKGKEFSPPRSPRSQRSADEKDEKSPAKREYIWPSIKSNDQFSVKAIELNDVAEEGGSRESV
jgi:hypothetical protein